jgi:hypothetical protein
VGLNSAGAFLAVNYELRSSSAAQKFFSKIYENYVRILRIKQGSYNSTGFRIAHEPHVSQ